MLFSKVSYTGFILFLGLVVAVGAATAAAPEILVIDDFERGIAAWTTSDKIRANDPNAGTRLVDVLPSAPGRGGYPGSSGAGLFTFPSASNSWASASRRVVGAQWAKMGAQRLNFWISSGGGVKPEEGVELILRGTYKNADGTRRDIAFLLPKPIRLDLQSWREVAIPLSDFKSEKGEALPPRLNGLYLLQFAQRGNWDSRFFTIDQLQVEGNGQPVPQLGDEPPLGGTSGDTSGQTSEPDEAEDPSAVGAIPVNVDFLRVQARVRPSANVSLGAGRVAGAVSDLPLVENPNFRRAIVTMDPRFVRLDAAGLSDLVDSMRPAFDFTRLIQAVKQVRAINREPLITISNPPQWGLSERNFALYAAQVAGAARTATSRPPRFYEVSPRAVEFSNAQTVAYYNRARAALKGLSRSYLVGGLGEAGSDEELLGVLLRDAAGLDFMSVRFYAATGEQPATDNLFAAARQVASLRAAATALDRSKFRNAPLYVTQSNLNAARQAGGVEPADKRVTEMMAAGWWATFLGNASRVSDQIFHNEAGNPEWGLLDARVQAYPAYYVLYLWNTYFPPGSERVEARAGNEDVTAIAVNTPTAHNLMLANTTAQDVTVRVGIRGFPVLRQARMHVYDDPRQVVRPQPLPKSAFQTIRLKPYGVTVVQFIEPPKGR